MSNPPPSFPPVGAPVRPAAPQSPAPRPGRGSRPHTRTVLVIFLLAVLIAGVVGGVLLLRPPAAASSDGPASSDRVGAGGTSTASAGAGSGAANAPQDAHQDTNQNDAPATGLDPELERRFEVARAAAADDDDVELTLTSGWRSAADQQSLYDAALERYGSPAEARRWALPPEASDHVKGKAIDVGKTDGAYWLDQHGAEFGLCRTYANEIWHFEANIEPGGTCPAMLPDAAEQ